MKAQKNKKLLQSNVPEKQNNKAEPTESAPSDSVSKYLALSFILPFAILGTAYAFHEVFPFGNKQIIVCDFFNQYYPFLSSFWHKLRDGSLSTWSWTAGLGHDYITLIAYYLASPLNLFALIAPHSWLKEVMTLALLVKIGCAGLFTAVFLRYTFKQTGYSLAVFSSLFALCAYTLGFHSNIIWFDSFALMPLVITGLMALMREGKYRLYICALALAVFSNYYMGFFVCVFTAIAFLAYAIIKKLAMPDFLRKLGITAVYSILAIGITCILLIPVLDAMRNIYTSANTFPDKPALYFNFFEVLGNFIAFSPPTVFAGLPNIYCGMISLLLLGLYIVSPKIPLREKAVLLGIVVFLLISCNINMLYHIMHGFRNTNLIPFRFSFLISFLMVIMAYRVFLLTDKIEKRQLAVIGVSAAFFLLSAVLGKIENSAIIGSAVLCAIFILIFFISMGIKTANGRASVKVIFSLVIITELFIQSWLAVKESPVPYANRDYYPDRYAQIQTLLAQRQMPADKTVHDFYRTDINEFSTHNDASLYNYNGFIFFSSTIDSSVTRFTKGLGVITWDNFVAFSETSPLISTFLNLRYFISRRGKSADDTVYWKIAGRAGDSQLLENKYHLPLGFMVSDDIKGYMHNEGNPFLSQNDLFRRATGIDGRLFMIADISALAETNGGRTTWDIKMPVNGPLYIYCHITEREEPIDISVNGTLVRRFPMSHNSPYMFTAGNFALDDTVTLSLEKKALMYIGLLNKDLFEQGYTLLADEPLNLTHFSETKVRGTVTALQDGILYTSIPGRNWNVYVDGVKDELLLIDNAMAAVRLSKGSHEVEFRYLNRSIIVGVLISISSLIIFIALAALTERKRFKIGEQQ